MVTAADAASQLGVTRRRVSELWQEGYLRGRKQSSGLSIELSSVHERRAIGPIQGRPWSEDVVWDVITTLSGTTTRTGAEVRRRIELHDHLALGQRIEGAIITARFDTRNRDQVRKTLALTGESAIERLQIGVSVRVVGDARTVRGYARGSFGAFMREFDLVESVSGDIIVHGFRSGEVRVTGETPLALVAADCLRSTNTRIRRAGVDALERMRATWLAINT